MYPYVNPPPSEQAKIPDGQRVFPCRPPGQCCLPAVFLDSARELHSRKRRTLGEEEMGHMELVVIAVAALVVGAVLAS